MRKSWPTVRRLKSWDIFSVSSVLGLLAGASAGGYRAGKLGRGQNVAIFLILSLSIIGALADVDAFLCETGSSVIVILVAILYICIGPFTAASNALFMDITDPRIGATQFSAFMGATNGCQS
jgi:hypothetical protein